MWVIPITSQIPDCTTKENKILLGFQANYSGPAQPLQKPQQNTRPHINRVEGYGRLTKDGGRVLPFHGPKFAKPFLVSKLGNSLHHVARREDALAVIKSDLEPIKIMNPREAKDLSNYCRGHGLFAKWGGCWVSNQQIG